MQLDEIHRINVHVAGVVLVPIGRLRELKSTRASPTSRLRAAVFTRHNEFCDADRDTLEEISMGGFRLLYTGAHKLQISQNAGGPLLSMLADF